MDKNENPKHGDIYYNKYGEIAGSWLVCEKCGRMEVRPAWKNAIDLGWTYNICPNCK
jgi:hypothetical protein